MEDFKVNFSDYSSVERFVGHLKLYKGIHIIHINPVKYQRSLRLNDYYHAVILPYWAEGTGFTTDELHGLFKEMYLPHVSFQNVEDLSTADCSQDELWAYCEKLRHKYYLFFTEDRSRPAILPLPTEVIRTKQPSDVQSF